MPKPGSPTIITSWPSPCRARSQRRSSIAISSSRPTSGVRLRCAGAAAAAARPDEPEQRHRLRHALERVRAALFRDEQAGDLALHPRRDQDRARLGQRLHPRRDVGDVAVNLARRIHHRRTGFEADAGGKFRLAGAGILAVQLGKRALDRQRRPRRAFGVVLLRDRIAEQRQEPVAELLRDMAAHLRHRRRSGVEIGADQVAPFLGIELRGNAGRADQIAEHHREIAALAGGFGRGGVGGGATLAGIGAGTTGGDAGVAVGAPPNSAIASSSFLRWPNDATPMSLRSSLVSRPSSSPSMSLARNISAYWARPILPSQPSMSKFSPLGSCQRQFLKRVESWRPP